jgi:predicted nuclease of predicted toxin-antitoxin system
MRVYLDDDLDSSALIGLLGQAGHQVVSPRAVGTRGISDEEHLQYASEHGLTLLTANARDFIGLHEEWSSDQRAHNGILIVYRENNPLRVMTFEEIAHAVTRLEQSNLPLRNASHNLNFWRRHVG